jgi:pimeloyl-ACP methyl ester carboxylesterase
MATTVEPGIESGSLPTGQPFARIGTGPRTVVYLPGLSFTHVPEPPKAIARAWKRWREPIDRHGLTVVSIGRRADLPVGSTAPDVADDYAAVIRTQFGGRLGVMGISSGGHYAQWLAIRHPDLVERLVLGFTAHRVPVDVARRQQRAVDHFKAGRWRSGWAEFGPWFLPRHPRIGSAITWLAGPHVGGRYEDLRVLTIDNDSDQRHDASGQLERIRCPTLVCSGGRDTAYPPDLVREMVAAIPDVRHVEYVESGHMGPGASFGEEACSFLASAS